MITTDTESKMIERYLTVQLLDILDQRYPDAIKIIVILNNARHHYSKEVREVVEQSPRLKLVFLPAYSPKLNLIECIWLFFKKKVLNNKYYENLEASSKSSIKFFRNINKYNGELASLLSGDFEGHHYT